MDGVVSGSVDDGATSSDKEDRVRVKRKTLQAVLQQCQMALASLTDDADSDDEDGDETGGEFSGLLDKEEADELCDLLRSRVECPDFLEKLESARMSVSQHLVDEYSSWDMVSKNDLWDCDLDNSAPGEYALIGQKDVADGLAAFMTAYLLSINHLKDVTPNQLKDVLSKTFSAKKKKGKLRKAWDGSKVIYNVASWGATAIGIYQNPALLRAATAAFWTSRHVISKLL